MIVPRLYEDLTVLHQNTLPVHAYFIPEAPGEDRPWDLPERGELERLQMLSGCAWYFRYYSSIHEVKEEFFLESFAADAGWKKEMVPFCWQMRGYDAHQYTNIRYPFPFDPPYVPQKNPCGAYRHLFVWHEDPETPDVTLCFEGVDSCFYVWMNGVYVGYSQVSHHTSEFSVGHLLREGENLLAVLVLKWCDGSYLEDQDKFRMSGIFRDVYLIRRPKDHIRDYVITTGLSDDGETADIHIRFQFAGKPLPVTLHLLAPETGELTATTRLEAGEEITLSVAGPLLWNAELPKLYTLIMETPGEMIRETVGIRSICVKNGIVLLNGSPIIFRGVNRHESNPVTGFCVDRAGVERDLRMIKAHNFNAVRASHYPNVPWFYQLCDQIGLYVIDEADNESHGTAPLYFNEDDYAERMRLAHERIADNPDFIAPTLDRVQSMVIRNRNRPSVLVWSMGNECGYGCTFEESLRWTKQTDPGRLTHYESAYYMPGDRAYDTSDIDLFGRMYPAFDEVTAYLENDPEKPLLLVEYCHAMGNSPGDFLEYRELTEKWPMLCGGFVWEWCDHAIDKGPAADGRRMYWYGGDHGELQHDGNFCLDGLVYPDRRPHTGLLEYKNVHRPLRSAYNTAAGTLTVENHWDFLEASALVRGCYVLEKDGAGIAAGEIRLPHLPARGRAALPLPLNLPADGRVFLRIIWTMKQSLPGLPEGHVLGFDECRIPGMDRVCLPARLICRSASQTLQLPKVEEDGEHLRISGEGFSYTLDTLTGCFVSWKIRGKEWLNAPADLNLWRAPVDNDRNVADLWRWERLDKTETRAFGIIFWQAGDTIRIRIRQSVAAMSVQPFLRVWTDYRIRPDGSIQAEFRAEKDEHVLSLPRIGLRLFLDSSFDQAEYYGIGPEESYADKCRAGWHGRFRAPVRDLHEDYIRPQENGSHADCDYVRLTGPLGTLSAAAGDGQTFSFNASFYSQEELESRQHNYELEESGSTILCLDHRMAGIGSASCGPALAETYRVDADRYSFAFVIRPEAGTD